jgi:hypothetical protein
MHYIATMRHLLRLAGVILLGGVMANAQARPDPAAQARIDEVVAAYGAAWNEPDLAARQRLLEKAWSATGTYTDPTVHLEGRDALAQHIAGFQKGLPGATIVPTSHADLHHGRLRFTWRLVKGDGSTLTEGIDFGELDAEGRIQKIVGFFGPVKPLDR